MVYLERIMSVEKDNIPEFSKELNQEDISLLVDLLSEKDDKVRYQALQLLQSRVKYANDVYPYWDLFREKLSSDNSYQRSIGIIMISSNVRWDEENKFEEMFEEFFERLQDEKPITVRQFIQSLKDVVPYKTSLNDKMIEKLVNVNLQNIRESMRKLILLDTIDVLVLMREYCENKKINQYLTDAITGGLLDKKSVKRIEAMLYG